MVKKLIPNFTDFINNIDTVEGHCPECGEHAILVAIVKDYYRCTICGEDTKQYVNGCIKYLRISKEDEKWLKRREPSGSTTT